MRIGYAPVRFDRFSADAPPVKGVAWRAVMCCGHSTSQEVRVKILLARDSTANVELNHHLLSSYSAGHLGNSDRSIIIDITLRSAKAL